MEGGLQPGTVLLEKYRVESVLGRGGMGVVLRVTHLHLGEEQAIKILSPDAGGGPSKLYYGKVRRNFSPPSCSAASRRISVFLDHLSRRRCLGATAASAASRIASAPDGSAVVQPLQA
jgi:serine/threonine protein kinase